MTEVEWKPKKINLSSGIIIGGVTFAIGVFIGLTWTTFAPYLGFDTSDSETSVSKINWSPLNEIYNKLEKNYDGEIDEKALIEGAKKRINRFARRRLHSLHGR